MKEKMRAVPFLVTMSFAFLFFYSCQSPEPNKWTPPRFVKEWEIKEIKPGIPHQIISMTANRNGVFVLVKAVETRYSPPKLSKKVTEMTEKEKENFINQVVMGRIFSGIAVSNMTKIDKDELITFILNHFIPPRNSREMTNREKEEIVGFFLSYKEEKEPVENKNTFRDIIQKEGIDKFINEIANNIRSAVQEEVEHFCIQHYDFDGNFLTQWPQENKLALPNELRRHSKPIMVPRIFPYRETIYIDSRDYLIKPVKIFSDYSSDIYLSDYEGNKIVRFDSSGKLMGLWKMFRTTQVGGGFLIQGGAMDKNGNILVIGEGELLMSPKLLLYNNIGKLMRGEELRSKIGVYLNLFKSNLIPPLMKIERISDMAVDTNGNIYLLSYANVTEKPAVIKLAPSWKEERKFKVILKDGFETPTNNQYEKYLKGFGGIRRFNSSRWSWVENGPGFYFPSKLFIDGNHIYVIFLGSKPFGVIDAIVYDSKGELIGYWKQESRSHMEWFNTLNPNTEVIDTDLSIAQNNSSLYVGRTMEIRTGGFYTRSVIQRFSK